MVKPDADLMILNKLHHVAYRKNVDMGMVQDHGHPDMYVHQPCSFISHDLSCSRV